MEKNLKEKLDELMNELERQKKNRYDIVVPTDCLIVLKEGNQIWMEVPQPDGEVKHHTITEWAHQQICEKTGIPKKYYDKMRQGDKLNLLAENVNSWLPSKDKRLVRVLDNQVRALLSDRYRIIDNYDVFDASLEEFGKITKEKKIGIEIKRADITEQHLYIKATSPDLTGEVFHFKDRTEPVQGGIIISNSEVGSGAFRVEPFINVLVCQNGLIGENSFVKVHLGRELGIGIIDWIDETLQLEDAALWSKIRDMIQGTFTPEVFQKWLDKINKVAQVEILKPVVAVDNIIKKYELPKERREALLNQFIQEGPTQWGLSMAVTRIAQDEKDYEKQIQMEKIGAQILDLEAEVLVKEI